MLFRNRLASFLVVTSCLTSAGANAAWRGHRHDAGRSARADRSSELAHPAIAWKKFLGSRLGFAALFAADVDGNGTTEFLTTSTGALTASTADGATLYSVGRGVGSIEGTFDFDGDGSLEVLVKAGGELRIFDAASGALRYRTEPGSFSAVGAVRVADFDGDGLPDVYATDMACGGVGGKEAAFGWSFAHGFSNALLLFELEKGKRDYVCGGNDAVADVDGDGVFEIIAVGNQKLYVYSTTTGSLLFATESVTGTKAFPYGQALISVGNIDDDPNEEIAVFTNSNYGTISTRSVYVLEWDEESQSLEKTWEDAPVDMINDRHEYHSGGFVDLDGDGSFEIVRSVYLSATNEWWTFVHDAKTGALVVPAVPFGPYRGHADLDGDGNEELFTGDRYSGIRVFGRLEHLEHYELLFAIDRAELLDARVAGAEARGENRKAALTAPVVGAAGKELFAISYGADLVTAEALFAVNKTGAETARRPLPAGTTVTTSTIAPLTTGGEPRPVVAQSNGYLYALAPNLSSLGIGVALGGYFGGPRGLGVAPLAADFDGDGADEIIVRDSRNALLRLDANVGASTPTVRWEIPGATHPVLIDADGDGIDEVAFWTTLRDAAIRTVRSADATLVWQRTLGSYSNLPLGDLLVGDLDGDGDEDILYSEVSTSLGNLVAGGLSGSDSRKLWAEEYSTLIAGWGVGGGALVPSASGTSKDYLAAPRNVFVRIAGATGTAGDVGYSGYADYGLATNLDEDSELEMIACGATVGTRALDHDLSEKWVANAERSSLRVNGVTMTCNEGLRYVAPFERGSEIGVFDAATGEVVSGFALEGGTLVSRESAVDKISILGNLVVSPDLTGDGVAKILVSSSDGYLYAVDPCAGTLTFALSFGVPVGEPIFADFDGDGADEIVVEAQDGYLYGIDSERFPSPDFIGENDGVSLAVSAATDVDAIVSGVPVSFNWTPVSGALGYEVNLLGEDSNYVFPDFVEVGAATATSLPTTSLGVGNRYFSVVRARGETVSSAATMSDGFVVLADPCSACGSGTVCESGICVAPHDGSGGGASSGGSSSGGCATGGSGEEDVVHTCSQCGAGTSCVGGLCVPGSATGGGGGSLESDSHPGGCSCALNRQASGSAPLGVALVVGFALALRRKNRGVTAPGESS